MNGVPHARIKSDVRKDGFKMLKIKNSNGEEIMRIYDDGTEEIFDYKLKEQIEQEQEKEKEKQKEGE